MAFYEVGDIVEASCRGTYYGSEVQITPHFRIKTIFNSDFEFAMYIRNQFLSTMSSLFVASCKWNLIVHRRKLPLPKTTYMSSAVSPLGGNSDQQGMPHQIAILLSLRTLLNAPSGRGRLYIPGMWQISYVNGMLESGTAAAYNNVRTNLKNKFATGGTDPMIALVVYFDKGGVQGFNNVNDIFIRTQPVVRRSRRPNTP